MTNCLRALLLISSKVYDLAIPVLEVLFRYERDYYCNHIFPETNFP